MTELAEAGEDVMARGVGSALVFGSVIPMLSLLIRTWFPKYIQFSFAVLPVILKTTSRRLEEARKQNAVTAASISRICSPLQRRLDRAVHI